MLEVIEFLREHGLNALSERYKIKTARHGRYPHLVLLKYNQISSPMHELIVQQCRGIIVDERDWSVVSRPYDKFFNVGENGAAPVDWSSARILEKLDGSLMTLYFAHDQWHVASSGLPDAQGSAGAGLTMHQLFWRTWQQLGYALPTATYCCFMFELMTPVNRIVVRHNSPRLVLHGARNLNTMAELEPQAIASALGWGWECVQSYLLTSLQETIEAAAQLDPLHSEGFIVRDAAFRRVKIKSPQYVRLHHLKDGLSTKRMLDVARLNEGAEFLSYFPEWADDFRAIHERYRNWIAAGEALYAELRDIPTQKDFALRAVKTAHSGALFAVRNRKAASIADFYQTMHLETLVKFLGLKEDNFAPAE